MSELVLEFPPEYPDDPSLDQYRFAATAALHETCEAEVERILGSDPKNLAINSPGLQNTQVVRPVVSPSGYEALESSGFVTKMSTKGGTVFQVGSSIGTRDGMRTASYIWLGGNTAPGAVAIEGVGCVDFPDVALATARLITPRLVTSVGFNPRRQRIVKGDGRDEVVDLNWLQRLLSR